MYRILFLFTLIATTVTAQTDDCEKVKEYNLDIDLNKGETVYNYERAFTKTMAEHRLKIDAYVTHNGVLVETFEPVYGEETDALLNGKLTLVTVIKQKEQLFYYMKMNGYFDKSPYEQNDSEVLTGMVIEDITQEYSPRANEHKFYRDVERQIAEYLISEQRRELIPRLECGKGVTFKTINVCIDGASHQLENVAVCNQ